ncbi:DUF4347 domain-containing protein [Pseudomonas sp. LFM046]|uniref:DUF4347 domain-containing protein n=1 Tax=Pseudomonas sp. LFM046 TaxID=1608357 RepID=UPI0006984BA0|nr:DUF4347 domain-containing protein [Pseudomonas sp. LFM046]
MWRKKTDREQMAGQPARSALALALEARMMFDGAVAATAVEAADSAAASDVTDAQGSQADATQHDSATDNLAATPSGTADNRQEVVFVDSQVKDYQQLIGGLKPGTEVVVLDANKDGLQQIADYLEGRSGIDAIHVISHGEVGKVQLGNDWLESGDIAARSELLNAIGQTLSNEGDILLYGCQIGANGEGQAFIDDLAAAAGADVAASSDLTGASSKGGDWVLESRSGLVETSAIDGAGYEHLLLAPADENYDDDAGQSFNNVAVFNFDGVKYTITGSGGNGYSHSISNDPFSPLGDGVSDYYLLFDSTGLNGISSIKVEATDGSAFRLLGLSIDAIADGNVSITPNGGSAINYTSNGVFVTAENINLSANTQFHNITSFTISGGNLLLNLDDLNFDSPQVIPSLTSATVADTNLKAGETSLVTFTFSTAVSGFTTADLTVDNGVITGLSSSDGGITWTGTLTPNASVTDSSNLIAVNLAGVTSVSTGTAGSGTANSNNYAIDTQLPTVTSVSSSTANGTYKAGDVIAVTVSFSEAVTVTGAPQLTLETGATDRVVNYSSGSGTNTLTFNYTVQAGDTSADLDYLSTGGLALNGGSIRDAASNDATLTLASPGAAGSLGANKNIVIDSAPSIGNVNGDSVAWAGVGSTVNLDSGSNAVLSDTEKGALNGGNGNWSGAILTVQRSGTAVPADTFGFDTSGALFTVNGSNLESGGQTFATFTSVNGVLTITFTSSGTAATTALINNVAQRVTYQNNTPAGDATIQYALSDGTSTATANVTVTSDTIYVTNTSDVSTIDASNGVGLREAVAIAAADATGTQTIILDSGMATQTITLGSGLSLGESLNFNADSASGLIISGSTITLGGGTTLSFVNGSGDTATVNSAIAGSGALAKSGAGTLTLGSTSNSALWSGAVSVTGGTLNADTGSRLSTGSLTLDGGTLAMTVTGAAGTTTTFTNAITLGTGGGTISVAGGGGANIANFSGVISGSGSLTKTTAAILQLSGNNTYTGATNVSSGTLIANHANALGTTAGGTTVSDGATARIAGALTIAESFTISGTGKQVSAVDYGAIHLTSGSSTLSGTITFAGDTDISAASGSTLTLTGALSGVSNLNKTDSGTLVLSNSGNEAGHTGGTTVTGGTLSIANDDYLGSGTITLNGGTLGITGATTIDNAIALASASTISNTANATLSGVLSGSGTLTKSGASTLTLSGSNIHSGAVNLTAGGLTLSGGSALGNTSAVTQSASTVLTVSTAETIGSLAGSGSVVLNAALTAGGDNTSTTYSGVISGTSGLTKAGSGTLTLTGNNAYTGATNVSAGGLTLNRVGGALDDNTSVAVASGATLTVAADETIDALSGAGTVALGTSALSIGINGTSSTFSGAITGSGTLTLDGGGTFTLSGTNSGQSWGMQVLSGGTVSVAGDANLSSGTVQLNDGTLSVTSSGTVDNAITLGASAGSVSVGSGLAVSLSGAIGGAGALTKTGSGTLTLSGGNNYSGTTTVSAGTLAVNGSTASATIVGSGATLAGSGILGGNVTVQSGGTLSPGISGVNNGAGLLTINGNLQMSAGSTLAVEINGTSAGSQYDQVVVNGTVNVSGATLAVTHSYASGLGDIYNIINNDAADAITGTFSGLADGATTTAGGNGTVLTAMYTGGTDNEFSLIAPTNAAPVVGNFNGGNSHTEGGAATVIDTDASVSDADLDPLNGGNGNYDGASLVVVRNGGANASDLFGFLNGNGITLVGSNLVKNGQVIGSFDTSTSGQLTLTFTDANGQIPTTADVNNILQQLTYASASSDPAASVTLNWTFADELGATAAGSAVVNIVAVNNAPTATATGASPTHTENGSAVDLFSGVSIGTVEAGQSITGLTFTVSGLANGASEILSIDGTDIALVNGSSGTTGGSGISYSVGLVGGTATITLTHAGISTASVQTVIDGMTYRNSSEAPAAGNRVVTLTSVRDSGGTSNGGVDTSSLAIAATVNVVAVNDAPVITAPGSISVSEDVAQSLTGISFSDVDAGTGNVTVTFSVASGSLGAISGSGVTVAGSGTGTLTLVGTVGDINAFIAASGVSFTTAANATANVTLSIGIDDGGNTGTDPGNSGTGTSEADSTTVTLAVTAVNDAPVNNLPVAQGTDQDANLVFNAGNGNLISISDVDVGGGNLEVTLTASNGLISLGSITGLSFITGDGTGDATLTFTGSLVDINNALNGLTFSPTAGYNGPASLQISTSDLGGSGSGGIQTDTDTLNITVNPINPVITGIGVSNPDGGYKVGDVITVTISFDQTVIVDTTGGVPSLLLETGLLDRNATYVSGSGSNTLTFSYTVQAGDVSADLDYQSTGALALNGGTIRNASSDDAIVTLPAVGGADSIAGQHDIVIDGLVPQVTSVTVPANGTYVAGQNLDFTVNLSEAVTVDTTGGTPRIAITLDGGGTVFADYVSGSGTTALVFRLTVSSGQLDTNGISVGGAILANGGTLRDGVGNDANTTLNNVASTTGVRVDAVVPTVSSVTVPIGLPYNGGDTLTFVVNASEAVFVNGTPRLALDIGGTTVFANYVAGSGTSTLVFQYTIQAGDNDANGIAVTGLAANGGTLRDGAGNDLNLSLNNIGNTSGVIVDTVAPSPSGIVTVDPSSTNAGSVRYTVTFSEDVSGVDLSDFVLVGAGTSGNLSSLVQIDARTYQVTVSGVVGTGTLGLNLNGSATGIVDAAGNAITGGLTGAVYNVDRDVPTVTSVGVPVGVHYNAGDTLTFVVNASEAVIVNGTPRLAIDMGGTTVFADYVAGSGSNTLVFQYTVRAGDNDANGIAVTGLVANGATLRDAIGNAMNLTLNGVGDIHGVTVDTTAPGASATVAPLPTPGSVQYTVTFDEDVSGVDLGDFNLVTTGNVTGTLQSLTQVDSRTFLVTVSNVAGAGTLSLALNATGTLITDNAGNAMLSGLSAQTYSVQQNDGDPEFRANPPVLLPPEPTVPFDPVQPNVPPPPFTSPLIPPPLFEQPTLGSGIPTLGNIFINQGALAPSFIAQVFASSDSFGDGSGRGFLGFGGGDANVFGSSSLSGFFNKEVPQDGEEMKLFDGKQWHGAGEGGQGHRGSSGAPTLTQQLQDMQEREHRQVRDLAMALGQIQADRPQA